jgi:deoxyribose-phosphate aldolase
MITFDNYPDYSPEQMEKRIREIKSKGFRKLDRKDALKLILNCIDLTTLEGADTHERVINLCKKAYSFSSLGNEIPNVAAVCVYPPFVRTAKKTLEGKGINVAAVAGAFPSGQSPIHVKLAEVGWTVDEGADEIDMVISRGTFLEGKYDVVTGEISAIKKECRNAHLKVILETGELTTAANIRKASELAILAGGDFIKTSTGKIQPAATEFATVVMLETIKEYFEKTGKMIGFKPAGGISEPEVALGFLMLVDQILGEAWMNNKYLRFGASRLADKIIDELLKV